MKKMIWMLLLAVCGHAFAQKKAEFTSTERISKQFTLNTSAAKTTFALYNLWGSVKVEGHYGTDIIIEVEKTINAKTEQDLKLAENEFKLGFIHAADSVVAYTAAPYNNYPLRRQNNNNNLNRQYYVQLNYTVKIPHDVSVDLSTVNGGELTVSNVYGKLKINNVNGAINIVNAKGVTNSRTVNGNLTASYAVAPAEACSYYTLNGKLTVSYPANYTGDVQFKSFNGSFYTDFDNTQGVASETTQQKNSLGETVYKLNKNNKLRIGSGGKLTTFETLNGNIYLKKI